jgi:hypothetical protein
MRKESEIMNKLDKGGDKGSMRLFVRRCSTYDIFRNIVSSLYQYFVKVMYIVIAYVCIRISVPFTAEWLEQIKGYQNQLWQLHYRSVRRE